MSKTELDEAVHEMQRYYALLPSHYDAENWPYQYVADTDYIRKYRPELWDWYLRNNAYLYCERRGL